MEYVSDVKLTVEEFMQICRSCLSKNNVAPLESNYIDIFNRIAEIQIDLNEGLPKQICEDCIVKIKEISTFTGLIKTNDAYLRQILEHSKKSNILESISENSDDIDFNQKKKIVKELQICTREKLIKTEEPVGKKRKICQFECTECDEIFSKKKNLNIHLKNHGKEILYECKVCLKTFKHAPNLKRHDRIVHKGYKPFKCEICEKEFATQLRKTEHLYIHTGERPYICNFCGLCFKKSSTRYSHEIRHKIKNGELPKSEKVLKKYPRKPSTNLLELKCEVCQKPFSSKQALSRHKQIHSGDKPFLCTECGKGFIRKNHLEVHERIHTGEKPYQCNDCGKRFRQPTVYRNHLLIHKNERLFKCDICQKSFIQSGHLYNHLKTHSGDKPYKCTFCGKAFAQNGNLRAHTRIHTNERPYRCVICSLGFNDSSSLKKHQKIHDIDKTKSEDS